ncbi:MAG: hypothetical protein KDL87_19555, partial [Verrucomicrobiae bacterium]|nr:hypothetical protein [Verrucomicrobiae bacterium]
MTRVSSAQEHLRREQERLGDAALAIYDAEDLVANPPVEGTSTEAILGEAKSRLGAAAETLAGLESGVDQEISDAVGRVQWAVGDSAAGFLKALDRLNDSDSGGDLAVSMIESRVWRDLSELRGGLSGLQTTLEAGAIAAPIDSCGKQGLLDAAAHALTEIETVQSLPLVEESALETAAEESEPAEVPNEAIESLQSELRKKDEEIERLRGEAGSRESELTALRESLAEWERKAEEAA